MAETNVPLLDLRPQYSTIRVEIDEAVRRVIDSQYFILGPEVAALETEIAGYCECSRAVGCASGTDAILLALMALDIGPGDQVICPSHTFFATAGSIHRLGAIPVFVDIDRVTYNIDPQRVREIAARCTRLKAIMPVHLYGQCVDMETFVALGDELGLPIIEDAAQAIGARDAQGRPAGSRGRIGCFSFFPSKNIGAFGDGGVVTTNDDAIADRIASLRVHGSTVKYHHDEVGLNSRLDALQAAVLRVKLKHLESWTDGRRENAADYDERFRAAGAVTTADDGDSGDGQRLPICTPAPATSPARHIYNQYVIRVPFETRDALREHLKDRNVATEIYYPIPLHRQPCFAHLGYAEGDLPESEAAARATLALPIYPELTSEQRAHVADTIIEFVASRSEVGVSSG